MKDFINKFMTWWNGKKSIIGSLACNVLLAFQDKIEPEWFTVLIALSVALTGVGLGHKGIKKLQAKK